MRWLSKLKIHPKKLGLGVFGAASCLTLVGAVSLLFLPTGSGGSERLEPKAVQSAHSAQALLIQNTWPVNDAELQGLELFRIEVQRINIEAYAAYWSIDGGQHNKMSSDSAADSSYKVATVDVGSWDSKIPHTLTYIVTRQNGQEADRVDLTVRIAPADAAPPKSAAKPAVAGQTISLPPANASNPIADTALYVDPGNPAAKQAAEWRTSRPGDAAFMDKLAAQPQARWFGDWNKKVQQEVNNYVTAAGGKLPVIVLYNIPHRHCSGGGAADYDQYAAWVQQVANGIGNRRSMVILEPDALPLVSCLSAAEQETRYKSLAKAVDILKTSNNITVYIDAGHGKWTDASLMAERLYKANIAKADGFSLNVANFVQTDINTSYGVTLSDKLSGRHFVIDTSRNGLGPLGSEWCNPLGRASGPKPTTSVGHPQIDAYLWVKVPGESDGTCNGGPSAGQWWPEYALGLIQRADW